MAGLEDIIASVMFFGIPLSAIIGGSRPVFALIDLAVEELYGGSIPSDVGHTMS